MFVGKLFLVALATLSTDARKVTSVARAPKTPFKDFDMKGLKQLLDRDSEMKEMMDGEMKRVNKKGSSKRSMGTKSIKRNLVPKKRVQRGKSLKIASKGRVQLVGKKSFQTSKKIFRTSEKSFRPSKKSFRSTKKNFRSSKNLKMAPKKRVQLMGKKSLRSTKKSLRSTKRSFQSNKKNFRSSKNLKMAPRKRVQLMGKKAAPKAKGAAKKSGGVSLSCKGLDKAMCGSQKQIAKYLTEHPDTSSKKLPSPKKAVKGKGAARKVKAAPKAKKGL